MEIIKRFLNLVEEYDIPGIHGYMDNGKLNINNELVDYLENIFKSMDMSHEIIMGEDI
jgi:hypothetical protein